MPNADVDVALAIVTRRFVRSAAVLRSSQKTRLPDLLLAKIILDSVLDLLSVKKDKI